MVDPTAGRDPGKASRVVRSDRSANIVTLTPTNTPTTTPSNTATSTFTVTRTRPPIPVVSSPASPAGLLLIGGLSIGLLWALRRLGRMGA